MDMIKVLVLDDSYHDKEVVMLYGNKSLLKVSLAYFINIHLCGPHYENYQVKTIHYEDIEDDRFSEMFDKLSHMKRFAYISDENLVWYFQELYDSDEVVDGCDIY